MAKEQGLCAGGAPAGALADREAGGGGAPESRGSLGGGEELVMASNDEVWSSAAMKERRGWSHGSKTGSSGGCALCFYELVGLNRGDRGGRTRETESSPGFSNGDGGCGRCGEGSGRGGVVVTWRCGAQSGSYRVDARVEGRAAELRGRPAMAARLDSVRTRNAGGSRIASDGEARRVGRPGVP